MKNLEVFQAANNLDTYTNYFEGWYFKHSEGDLGISFIPGISIKNGVKNAFIQVITKSTSYCIFYDFSEFIFSSSPFSIQIGKSIFSKEKAVLDIENKIQNVKISGNLYYTGIQEIEKTKLSPNIMGPFSHIPFMECNHAILSMKHTIKGKLIVNEQVYNFNNGTRVYRKGLGNFISKNIFMVPSK